MIIKAILKKPWKSPRGRVYPEGSTFKLVRRDPDSACSIYDFRAPGIGHGWVVFPDKIFKKLTEEEIYLRDIRKKMIEEHIRKTKSPLL